MSANKPELRISASNNGVPLSAHWDGMAWPLPDLTDGDQHTVQWKLRYAHDQMTKRQALAAASIVAAYYELIMLPQTKRNKVASVLKNLTKLWEKQ